MIKLSHLNGNSNSSSMAVVTVARDSKLVVPGPADLHQAGFVKKYDDLENKHQDRIYKDIRNWLRGGAVDPNHMKEN